MVSTAPRRLRPARTPVAAVVLLACCGTALADEAEQAPLVLKPSAMLQELLTPDAGKERPTFVRGDAISGRTDLDTTIDGKAELRRADTVIKADHIDYSQPDDQVKANGNVRVNRAGNVYEGEKLDLKVEAFQGSFEKPSYQFLRNDSYGQADRIDFIDDKRSIMRNASLSTCKPTGGPDWMPAWILKAATLDFDQEEDVGQAEGATLRFLDIPILPFPSFDFPLSEKRKSGFLPPTVGIDNLSGLDLTLPYYWNIAPNRDATLYSSLMSRRGINLGAQFRYLESNYNGTVRGDYMPTDKLRDRERWGYSAQHNGTVNTGWADFGPLSYALNLNRVSDDNYWRDFPRATASLTQRLLSNDGVVNWSNGNLTSMVRVQKFQTLQDVTAPITPPYDRLPQLNTRYTRTDIGGGFDVSFEADATHFVSDPTLTLQPNATRSYAIAQVSRPWVAPGWFVIPKAQFHYTNYQFDAALANGRDSQTRALPTLSLDSGLILERKTQVLGRDFVQTLEPRAFYTYTPFRDQNFLPNYDSAPNDFNFATVYTENAFGGNDRISDNNLLTLGVTTRLLDPQTGAEAARFGVAQRLRFKDQLVTLPGGTPQLDRISDLLAGVGLSFDPKWSAEGTVQYNQKLGRSVRTTIGGRYSPSPYRVLSAAYRLQRADGSQFPASEQIDVGFQWPLNDLWGDKGLNLGPGRGQGPGRWYGVGRLNYSLQDNKMVDSIIGLEYDAGCWIGRIVAERLQRSGTSANQRILFQLELVGFSRLGSNPLKTLKDNIPRYQFLREQTTSPSRFTQYD